MKNKVAPNRKTGRMITKNLIILLVLVVVTFISAWSWFTNKTTATADGIDVQCNMPDGVEFAVVEKGGTPTEEDFEVNKNSEEPFGINKAEENFLQDLELSELTSDGKTFYRPVLNQTGGIAIPDTRAQTVWNEAIPNDSYISFDIYFRSKTSYPVYLNKGSYIKAQTELEGKDMTGADSGNISTYGNFSKDNVVGALRVSAVDYDTNKLKFLWIPRPDILFSSDTGNSVATGVTSGESYQHFYYLNPDSTTKEKELVEFKDSTLIKSALDPETDIYSLPEKMLLSTLTEKKSDGYFYDHVTINIWVDGNDAEARLALVNGQFVINLDLTIKE